MKKYLYLNNGSEIQVCLNCIYDIRVPGIFFDKDGICNYCKIIDNLKKVNGTGQLKGKKKFDDILIKIKKEGKNKKYDCVIGVSGGTDSSFLLHKAKKDWGLRPLAVHYDNTFNSSIATEYSQNVKSIKY